MLKINIVKDKSSTANKDKAKEKEQKPAELAKDEKKDEKT